MPTSTETVRVEIFWMPKEGHTTSEYEDAYATSDPDRLPFRAAVADGATESAYSGPWARRLTSAFTQSGDLGASLQSLRDSFHRISRRGHVPWYLQEKSAEGSHAAFAGLEIHAPTPGAQPETGDPEPETPRWTAQAVGDCCILHVRSGDLLRSWPIDRADAFSSTPELISSRGAEDEDAIPETSGEWQKGDRFILATDALAAWLLEHGPGPIDNFDEVVEAARRDGSMRNDDVTAIVVDL